MAEVNFELDASLWMFFLGVLHVPKRGFVLKGPEASHWVACLLEHPWMNPLRSATKGLDALACVAGATITPTYLSSFSVPWRRVAALPRPTAGAGGGAQRAPAAEVGERGFGAWKEVKSSCNVCYQLFLFEHQQKMGAHVGSQLLSRQLGD